MYLDKSQRNKFTIGKVFRRLKNLRAKDPAARIVPMPKQLQQYYEELMKKGLEVKNLKFAMFQTRNGLEYPGLIAAEKIVANTILVKVPVQCLLTTRDAFLSEIEKIFVENPGFFSERFTSDWEDRIILTYLLYEYQKGKKSQWYNLIRNLPKDIDYAVFWSKEEIGFMEDPWIARHIEQSKQKFEQQCAELITILRNYPEFFSGDTLKRQNIIWLHTHLVTRCFGKYFEYTTMVPFAELFNHQCVDVYYTMYYKPGNPHDEKQQFYDEKELTQGEMDQGESSDGSYDAEDFDDDQEFVDRVEGPEWDLSVDRYDADTVKGIRNCMYHMFTYINFSDSISLHFVKQILKELENIIGIGEPEARRKKLDEIHSINTEYIRKAKQFYKKIRRKYYTYSITQKQKPKADKPTDQPQKGLNYFQDKQWPVDKFDQFYMLCSTKDQFDQGAQVFFCYGRLPNKLLLMRYGIALEYNKYDHVFIRINIEQEVNLNPRLRVVLKQIQMRRYVRFKVKRTKMCVELVTYFRMSKWKYGDSIDKIFVVNNPSLQIQVLRDAKQFYVHELSTFKNSLSRNQQQLSNKYFGLVYKVEQQRIFTEQIKMIDYAIEVLVQIKQGRSLREVLAGEKMAERITYQIMMETYFKMFEIGG